MTTDEILDDLLTREGGWRDAVKRPDGSWDPATNRGITLDTLVAWRTAHGRPTPTVLDLRRLDADETRAIYLREFVTRPGFTPANIPFEPLRIQLIDFGVNSGPARAIRWLQRVLAIEVTGVLDARTVNLLRDLQISVSASWKVNLLALVNDALVAARTYMIDQATDQGSMRKADEEGVESRALSFFLAKP